MKLENYNKNKNKNIKEIDRVKERTLVFSIVRGVFLKVYTPFIYSDTIEWTPSLIMLKIVEMESPKAK